MEVKQSSIGRGVGGRGGVRNRRGGGMSLPHTVLKIYLTNLYKYIFITCLFFYKFCLKEKKREMPYIYIYIYIYIYNEIDDLKTRLARLEAKLNSSLIVDGIRGNGTCMSYEEEEEDTCLSLIVHGTTNNRTEA